MFFQLAVSISLIIIGVSMVLLGRHLRHERLEKQRRVNSNPTEGG